MALGADKIATGHYARIETKHGQYELLKACDSNKDQSYFLCRLSQQQLSSSLFPIGEFNKTRIRELASQAGFVTHDKKDSTGICFIGERPFREFLSQYLPIKKGEIQTIDGTVIGEHEGVHLYTLGQRQGLGIGGVKGAIDAPWYVVAKNIEDNALLVAQGHDHPLLFSRGLKAVNLHWIGGQSPNIPYPCKAKTRYRQADQTCTIESLEDDQAEIRFAEAQRAVTPGQYVVFYEGNMCLGGGVIDSTWN